MDTVKVNKCVKRSSSTFESYQCLQCDFPPVCVHYCLADFKDFNNSYIHSKLISDAVCILHLQLAYLYNHTGNNNSMSAWVLIYQSKTNVGFKTYSLIKNPEAVLNIL